MKQMEHNQEIGIQATMAHLAQSAIAFQEGRLTSHELAEIVIDATDTFALYQDILKKNGAVLPRVLCQHSNMLN